jgi:hypothetical protein
MQLETKFLRLCQPAALGEPSPLLKPGRGACLERVQEFVQSHVVHPTS